MFKVRVRYLAGFGRLAMTARVLLYFLRGVYWRARNWFRSWPIRPAA